MVSQVGGGGGWLQNHWKCIGLSSFSSFWKCLGRRRLAPESKEMHIQVIIFIILEVGGGGWLQNHKKCVGGVS